jgi:hypothetical protein
MTTDEFDDGHASWAILGDRGYVGNPQDGERRLAPVKGRGLTRAQETRNLQLSKIRVPVEHFFGRLKKVLASWNKPYPFEEDYFDADFRVACGLTNCLIRITELRAADYGFALGVLQANKDATEERKQRKQRDNMQYRAHVRARNASERNILERVVGDYDDDDYDEDGEA